MAGLRILLKLSDTIADLNIKHKAVYRQLQRALGVLASSEKRGNASKSKADHEPCCANRRSRDPKKLLQEECDEAKRFADWHQNQMKKQKSRGKTAKKRLDALETVTADTDDTPLTAEEEREHQANHAAYLARAQLGDGADPALREPPETLMQGGFAHVVEEEEVCEVERDTLPKGAEIKRSFWEERQRLEFRVVLAVKNIEVEKLVIAQGRDTPIVSADIQEYGPPKMAVTWSFLAHMTLLVSQFAMPMHRLAKLVSSSTKRFSAAELSRYYRFVAEHFVPIYRHLGCLLADAPVLSGDDTPSLVLEVDRALKRQTAGSKEPLPWQGFGTQERARKTVSQNSKSSLSAHVARDFGFESPRKDGTGSKISFNTSMLSGRAVLDDPATTIIFYRSHLGSVGNLLDVILPTRRPEHQTLVIQTDLSTTNLISDKQWLKRFDVRLAGCAYHARRPFALFEQEDPMWCEFVLHAFKGIPITERYLDLCGRSGRAARHSVLAHAMSCATTISSPTT